jgi:hypothetical protein
MRNDSSILEHSDSFTNDNIKSKMDIQKRTSGLKRFTEHMKNGNEPFN